jgi:hypothetical protein
MSEQQSSADSDVVPRSEMLEALANQRRRMGAEYDTLYAKLKRVREVARAEIERLSAAPQTAPPLRAERERRMVAEISFDPTNHHNALKCPYCNPKGLAFAEPQSLPTREEIAKAIGVALYGEDTFRSPDLNGWNLSAVLPAADATIALAARSQAVSAQHRYDQDGQICPTCGRVGNSEG